MHEHDAFWAGDFGTAYTQRNRVDWSARVPFWEDIVLWLNLRSVLEVGCNAGWNLSAINSIDNTIAIEGVEINATAASQARKKNFTVHEMPGRDIGSLDKHDLVFTSGVLIHVPPADLAPTMKAIVDNSSRYVVAIEYEDDEEVEVEYRGHGDRLWRRPYGKLYQGMGLRIIETGEAEGWDRCTYWVMEKK